MRTQRRNKRTIYLCQKYIENNRIFYKEPIELKENYNVTNSDADIIAMGMEYPTRLRIKTDLKAYVDGEWVDRRELYHVGDRVYVFNKPPKEHDKLCKTADYEVEIEPELGATINQLDLLFLRLSGKSKSSS